MFYGAGEAGTGIGEMIAIALHSMHGLSIEEVRLPHGKLQIQSKEALGAEPCAIGVITALQLHPQLSQRALRQH